MFGRLSFYSRPSKWSGVVLSLLITVGLAACSDTTWNNPYPEEQSTESILYAQFAERPKHLDPVRSYSANEYTFLGQIYEPPLQYHFLKRPYELVPLSAEDMPTVRFLDESGQVLPDDAGDDHIAISEYTISIKPGIQYQPHPALARNAQGELRYHDLSPAQIEEFNTLADFEHTGTRELIAEDFVYQIKRMADPKTHSPIASLMAEYIIGMKAFSEGLVEQRTAGDEPDLRTMKLEGVYALDETRYQIRLQGKYPQFIYWLSMSFFAPMPWEAIDFYDQPGMDDNNISLDWFPIGTGPFMLSENNPNRRMVLEKNPNFHGEVYPDEGEVTDTQLGLLEDAGQALPLINKAIYSLEKEAIPSWNKFLQGYYDNSGVSSDSFDQAVQVGNDGGAQLTDEMKEKGIRLLTAVTTSTFYMGFNMLDEVVGGDSERARKLRQAISIAIDYEEYVSIFANGRGVPAQGPIPPGIFGHVGDEAGINPVVYEWDTASLKPKRKSIEQAKSLMVEAGYPDGRDLSTGKQLILFFDSTGSGPGSKALLDWLVKQFRKLGIDLVIRATDYNRFQEKMHKGTAQIFQWGWNADYPDPENFFFLLYGPNGKVAHKGENAANYKNADFDALFDQMKNMQNGDARQAIIDQMVSILREDAPWLWGWHPVTYSLHHSWYKNAKPNLMANNTLKYKRIDPVVREDFRKTWNQPVLWPIKWLLILFLIGLLPAIGIWWRREKATAR